MKTATITLHSAHNNGSFLQAYALQKSVIFLGYENKIINFVPKEQYALYQNIVFKGFSLKNIIKGIVNIPHYRELKERVSHFNRALSYLNTTEKFEDEREFTSIVKSFGCLIAGSDQIWNNATMPDYTPLYTLPTDTYKISYAPSFGKTLANQFNDLKFMKAIHDFDRLSVREKSVQKILQTKFPDKRIELVLDPTFLVQKDDYEILTSNSHCKFKGDYIFFYCIKASNQVLKTVKALGEKLNLPIITVFTGVNTYKCQIFGQNVDFSAGPEEFVAYIKNARYVVSNSFHGIAFSIIYNKIFFRIADNDNGKIKIDERLDSLLDLLELSKQNLIAGTDFHLNTQIDFIKVNKKLEFLRQDSLTWLYEAIKGGVSKGEG